jgi:hypothetical protein
VLPFCRKEKFDQGKRKGAEARNMSVVNILNIQVLDNPTKFFNPFQFEITFECISALKEGKSKFI